MNLLDHFHPPLGTRRHWHSFHHAWATTIAYALNSYLPPGYFAEPNVQFGIEIDVATFEEQDSELASATCGSLHAEAGRWSPPSPLLTIPLPIVTDTIEVLIYDSTAGPVLAGAIELVSPANKDRASHREAFVSKCETYLQQGVGLVIVDIVTERRGNLHTDLLERLKPTDFEANDADQLYASAYRPIDRKGEPSLDIWHEVLAVGNPLPKLPLWLRGEICLPVELGATYERTCIELRTA